MTTDSTEDKYRNLFENMRDAIYLSSTDGRFVDVNRAMVELLGYESKEELLEIHIPRDFYHSEGEREKIMAEMAKNGYARDCEVEIKRKDGSKLVVLETCRERRDGNGNLAGYEGILHDITARKEEEKLRESIYRISEAVHSTRDFDELLHSIHEIVNGLMPAKNFFIALFDSDTGKFSLPYFADEYGEKPLSEKLWNGLTGYVLRTGKAMLVTPEIFGKLAAKGEVERMSTPSKCWVGAPLKIKGRSIGVLVVQSYTDGTTFTEKDKRVLEFVSDQVAMAIERKRAEREILELNEMLHLVNKIMRHDILNDMNVIRGMVEIYSEDGDKELMERAFRRIDKSVELIRRMRDLEMLLSSGKELGEYSTREIAESVAGNYDAEFNITGDCTVMADEAFHSVMDNIVRNAVVHGGTDKIDIIIESRGKECDIRIADHGKGIPDEIKEKIFNERFRHGETGGTGLGLYIVKKTIERYGGSIHVEDNEPRGAVFVIKLKNKS
ncbi:MAG: PAS domain S-box protein [Thermoplasmata archaeon]|nr:PAS domain S-box protein [Thermoplasmata archaeon]